MVKSSFISKALVINKWGGLTKVCLTIQGKDGIIMVYDRILIYFKEDKREAEDNLKRILRKYGYRVAGQRPSNSIINQTLKEEPHIILINIPDYEDYSPIIKSLKCEERSKNIPILILIHKGDEGGKLRVIELGVDDYLELPLNEKELVFKIDNLLSNYSNIDQLSKMKMALKENLLTIERQRSELDYDLTLASKIQESLIPTSLGDIPNCSFAWHFQPSGKVGGDIFDVCMLDDEHMGLYMIDVMGHGVASSMLAVALSQSLKLDIDRGSPLVRKIDRMPYYEIVSPAEVIHYLNERFPYTKYQYYFTMFYMVLNTKTGIIKYAKGGHPTPILIRDKREFIELDAYGVPVGLDLIEKYQEKTFKLEAGDNLIIYTDGVLELVDKKGNKLEEDGFIKYLKNEMGKGSHQFLTYNINRLARQQAHLKDDLSILEMKWM